MQAELQLARFVTGLRVSDVAPDALRTTRRVLLAAIGTGIAGALGTNASSMSRRVIRATS